MTRKSPDRRKRAHGEESRQRILDAAAEIAGERGYDGTSIALVSERSGLPASSIYWHFEDKDRLIAAVIERSFGRWLEGMRAWTPSRPGTTREELLKSAVESTANALIAAPDFLRLGLMLALDRRPDEVSARTMYLQVRDQAYRQLLVTFDSLFGGELDADGVRDLVILTMAGGDGLFIAHEIDPSVDLRDAFQVLAAAVLGAAAHLRYRSVHSSKAKKP
ncbi:MAG: TetR/AcrR family transcriptional regulator [Deltaproteobacteria bacterium]|nr:TetR/AcrR family transcriptional regulator [Deltaproteobacteria bacterium]